jgi:hypothetical protein
MLNFLNQLFCNHNYKYDYPSIIRSEKHGNDNYVIECTTMKCCKCGKLFSIETVSKIENNFYKS